MSTTLAFAALRHYMDAQLILEQCRKSHGIESAEFVRALADHDIAKDAWEEASSDYR